MSTLTNYAIAILTSVLFTRWQTENTKIRDYYGSSVAAVIVWTLASFIWNKFIYVFYTSQLRHLPLIKVSYASTNSLSRMLTRGSDKHGLNVLA
jgi:hypothetical protein